MSASRTFAPEDADSPLVWPLKGGRRVDFGGRVQVMGILNTTPDSFYDGGRYRDAAVAARAGLAMVEEGADIIDVGGESSRPPVYGEAQRVDVDEELRRVVPVIETIRRQSDVAISVDTTKSEVADQALAAGADIVNDISAFSDAGQAMIAVVRDHGAPVILMHRRGTAATMQRDTRYNDLLGEVGAYLRQRAQQAFAAGIRCVATDPGVGFGKSGQDNYRLLRHAADFAVDGGPVLIGASRKSFLWQHLGRTSEQALAASLAAAVLATVNGARILRVHDVAATVDAVKVTAHITAAA